MVQYTPDGMENYWWSFGQKILTIERLFLRRIAFSNIGRVVKYPKSDGFNSMRSEGLGYCDK